MAFTKEDYEWGFVADGGYLAGRIVYISDPKLLADGKVPKAFIEPDPRWQFSEISKGARKSLFSRGRTESNEISEWVPALAYLIAPRKPEFIRERLISGSGWAQHRASEPKRCGRPRILRAGHAFLHRRPDYRARGRVREGEHATRPELHPPRRNPVLPPASRTVEGNERRPHPRSRRILTPPTGLP
jgi:hypothetical protein